MLRCMKMFFLICLSIIVFQSQVDAQLPEFLNRLSGGSVKNKDFKITIPFTFIDGRICVKANINGSEQEYNFIIDTYAPCLIRESLAYDLKLDILDCTNQMGKQLEGSIMMPLFPKYQTLSLGTATFNDIGAMVMREYKDNPFAQVLENGLIGANLLKWCIWQFDFQDMKIVITDRLEKLDNLTNAVQIPFKPVSVQQSPNIQVVLDDKETIDVQFDTGSKGFLTFSTASLLSIVDSGNAVALHRRSVSPVKKSEAEIDTYHFAKLSTLKIGTKAFFDLPVAVYKAEDTKATTRGSIGMDFMKNFIVTIDWPEKQLHLKQIEGRNLKHNLRTFGLTYSFFDGAMRVESIYGGSEAEKSGIKIGALIMEINGHKVDTLSDEQVQMFLHGKLLFSRETDDSLSLVVMIDNKQRLIKLLAYSLFR